MPAPSQPHVGVDFDNTIVCYDELFHRVAREQNLIPFDLPRTKADVRNHLRATGREPAWTAMQGIVYGPRIPEAEAFPGVREFFETARKRLLRVSIVSHKTLHPIIGERYDLHGAAIGWLFKNGILDLVGRENVHLEVTKDAKLARIGVLGCTHFIDDLPELLTEPSFPASVQRILFDPSGSVHAPEGVTVAHSWEEIRKHIAL